MRLLTTFLSLLCTFPALHADTSPQDTKTKALLEKSGAEITVDDSIAGEAKWKVAFEKADDKQLVPLKGLKHVYSLKIADASKVTDRSMQVIASLKNLQELSLYQPAISNTGLSYLKAASELRSLFLSEAPVGDVGVSSLKTLSKLEEVDLSGTRVTNACCATLKTLPAVKSLALSKTKFSDAGVANLKEMKSLKELYATNTDLTAKGAMALEAAIPGVVIRR